MSSQNGIQRPDLIVGRLDIIGKDMFHFGQVHLDSAEDDFVVFSVSSLGHGGDFDNSRCDVLNHLTGGHRVSMPEIMELVKKVLKFFFQL